MTTWLFVVRHRDTGTIAGGALIALEARYVAGCWFGAPRLDRAFAPPRLWNEIRRAFSIGLPLTPLPITDVLSLVLLGYRARDFELQFLTAKDIEVDSPDQAMASLDDVLIRHAGVLQTPTRLVG